MAAFLRVENYDAQGFERTMREARSMFTDAGWMVFMATLRKAGVPEKVQRHQYDVAVETVGPADAVRLAALGEDSTIWQVGFMARLEDRLQAEGMFHYVPMQVCVKQVGVTQDHPDGLAVCGIHAAQADSLRM